MIVSFARAGAWWLVQAAQHTDTLVMRQQTAEVPLSAAALEALQTSFATLEREVLNVLAKQGFPANVAHIERSVLLKYSDTDSTLTLALRPHSTPETLTAAFLAQYRTRFGFHVPGRAIVVDTIGVSGTGRSSDMSGSMRNFEPRTGTFVPLDSRPVFFDGAWVDTPFIERQALRPGDALAGPAVICERNTTVVVERGWRATLTHADNLVLEKTGATRRESLSTREVEARSTSVTCSSGPTVGAGRSSTALSARSAR